VAGEPNDFLSAAKAPEILRKIRERTPARLLSGRVGASYRTNTQIELREAHAAARDAVRTELEIVQDFGADFVSRWGLFEVGTQARQKEEFLLRPDFGRHFPEASRGELGKRCTAGKDFQVAIGDGLSVSAVAAQVPSLLPLLIAGAQSRGWTVGQTFVIRHCRVGILNDIGELLEPKVAILLIGERPGFATAKSLSAYMAYRPSRAHSDADRNLISNIHSRGTAPAEAATRILNLAARMMDLRASGCGLREEQPADSSSPRLPGEEA
jgi:ethanolamine ammonia-lyase small subunit